MRGEWSGAARGAYFYAQGSSIYQLLGDEKLGQGTIEECFSGFFQKKIRMVKKNRELLEMLGNSLFLATYVPYYFDVVV